MKNIFVLILLLLFLQLISCSQIPGSIRNVPLCSVEAHSEDITSLVFSPDGTRIFTAAADDKIKVWNTLSGELINEIDEPSDHRINLAISPDGKTLASCIYMKNSIDGSEIKEGYIRFRNTDNWNITWEEVCQNTALGKMSFNPDGTLFAACSWDKKIKIWSVETKDLIHTMENGNFPVMSLAFSPCGKLLASGSSGGGIRLWSVETGDRIRYLEGHHGTVSSLHFSPDGKTLSTGWTKGNRSVFTPDEGQESIKLWSMVNGEIVRTFDKKSGGVLCLDYSPDGQSLVTGGGDKFVSLWSPGTGSRQARLHGHSSPVDCVSFSPDGKYVASAGRDFLLNVWEVNNKGSTSEKIEIYENDFFGLFKSVNRMCDYAWSLCQLGRYSEAMEICEKAEEKDKTNAWPQYNIGVIYSHQDDINNSTKAYSKALEIDPNHLESYINRGLNYYHEKKFDEAIQDYESALVIEPDDSSVLHQIALTYFHMDEIENSIDLYNKIIQHEPNDSYAYNGLACNYLKAGNNEQALKDVNHSLDLNPEYAHALDTRGWIYLETGSLRKAMEDFNKALETHPEMAMSYFGRGQIYYRQHKIDLARADFEKAKDLNPELEELDTWLNKLNK